MNKHPFIPAVRDLAEKIPELQAIRRITVRKEKEEGMLIRTRRVQSPAIAYNL